MRGSGVWIESISNFLEGDPDQIISHCKSAGLQWIAVKSGEARRSREWSIAALRLVRKCHDAGIRVLTWNLSTPVTWREQIIQIESVFADGVDEHIVVAEHLDREFVNALRVHFPDKIILWQK